MNILDRLLHTGKTPILTAREERLLKFCNATVLIVLVFIVANILSFFAFGVAKDWKLLLVMALHFIFIAGSLVLNKLEKYLFAKVNFALSAIVFVSFYAIAYGKTGHNYLFLPMITYLLLNLFDPREKTTMHMLLVMVSIAYFFVLYANHQGYEAYIDLDKSFLEIQGKVTQAGYLGLTLAFGFYNFFLISNAENKLTAEHRLVTSQKKIIEKAHQEITDSIRYAQRIQHAIMPSDNLIRTHLKDSFILYRPKNVVAGDFYWLLPAGHAVLFAVADCTGHGVPGAMVSLICNNGLNRSVKEYQLSEPGAILEKTTDLVIGEFETSELEVKDGMDIALCKLDGFSLSYAGANNPLWIIRNGELIEMRANRQPIGKFDYAGNFTTQHISLQEGDSLYLFTDGFSDQLGGSDNKRFTKNRLKALLLSLQNKPMQEQRDRLLAELELWRGTEAQTDDVCVMGLRI
jgi:serine phosphatase RsbU (regulator of sigma subunit)